MEVHSTKCDDLPPGSERRENPILCGAKLALIMTIGMMVFSMASSLALLAFHSYRGFDWVIAEAKGGLSLFGLTGCCIGAVVGAALALRPRLQEFPKASGAGVGAVTCALSWAIWASVWVAIRIAYHESVTIMFGPKEMVVIIAIFGGGIGLCVGAIAGWSFDTSRRSVISAILRVSMVGFVIGFLLGMKG